MRASVPAVLVAVLVSLPAPAAASDWPMWRYDASRSAASPQTLTTPMYVQWVREFLPPDPAWLDQSRLKFDVSYEPVVAGTRIFVPSMVDDSVAAYSTANGSELWKFYTDGPVRFAPAVSGGNVYFASDDGYLYCLNASTGVQQWKFRGGPSDRKVLGNRRLISAWPARGGPVIVGTRVYFAAGIWPFEGVFIYALNATTGSVVWANTGSGAQWTNQPHNTAEAFGGPAPQGYLVASGNRLLTPCGRSVPAGFNISTGDFLYFLHSSNRGESFVWASDPYFYCDGHQYNLSDGADTGTTGYSKLDITANGVTCSGGGNSVSVGAWSGTIDGTPSSLIAADGKLFAVTTGGKLYCFGPTDPGAPTTYGPPSDPLSPTPDSWQKATAGMLFHTGATEGCCLVWGVGTGRLVEELVLQSDLKIIAVDPDPAKITALRQKLDGCGLYGTRVAAHVGDPLTFEFPPHLASLIVSEDEAAGGYGSQAFAEKAFYALRPYGGALCLVGDHGSDITQWASDAKLDNGEVSTPARMTMLRRMGPLPGSDDWTHQYGKSSNTVKSDDTLVKLPLGLLWFGGELVNYDILPRHGHGPPEQVAGGRLFIEGPNELSAVDVYTGRLLWQRNFPGVGDFYNHFDHEAGANSIGTNYVACEDSVYVAKGQACYRLDAATGETLAQFQLPKETGDADFPEWGYVGVWDDLLVAGSRPIIVNDPPYNYDGDTADYTSSRRLVVMDRYTGNVEWKRFADAAFRHNSFCMGADKLFVIDRLSATVIAALAARGEPITDDHPRILALDVRTGGNVWDTDVNVFGSWLGYAAEYDMLLQAGRSSRDNWNADETTDHMITYQGSDGTIAWDRSFSYPGGPCILHNDMIIVQYAYGYARSLLTGDRIRNANPLTGNLWDWIWWRRYGCNTGVASEYLLTFRSGAAGYYDMKNYGGTGNLGGFKSGCTSNLVAANGVLNAPDYTRTCTCRYQNQASLAFVHRPEAEVWTYQHGNLGLNGAIRRIGVNFGAPGDRRADDGTLWLDYPSPTVLPPPSPAITVTTTPANPTWFRKHSSQVTGGSGPAWVAASGATNLTQVVIELNKADSRTYRVRVIRATDAGGGKLNSSVTETTQNATDTLTLSLSGWVCGIEIVEQDVLNNCAEVTIQATDDTATEGTADTGTFLLSRTGSTASQLTVSITVGGSAEDGDCVLSGAALEQGLHAVTFAPGSATATITLTPQADADYDDETLTITVNDGGGYEYNVGTPAEATVLLVDPTVAPTVVNLPATNVALDSATLNGEITDTGGEDPTVTIYWGLTNEGTTAGNWDDSVDMGTLDAEAFSADIAGLSLSTTYYYRCYADNSAGGSWASSTASFLTAASATPPAVENRPATNVTISSATLNGEVTDMGGEAPTVTIYWGTLDGGTTPVNWDNVEDLGLRKNSFSRGISGLTLGMTYYFRCYADNSGGGSWAPSTASFDAISPTETFEVRVATGDDDAEENAGGGMYLTSSDLELTYDGSNQTIGVRFVGVNVPQGTTITSAYVQFEVDTAYNDNPCSLTVRGEDVDDAAMFVGVADNISSRPTTTASVSWSPPDWNTVGVAGPDQRTSDTASIIQEIVDRPGWASGNALVMIITGVGERVAASYNGNPGGAPLLHVESLAGQIAPEVRNWDATSIALSSATLNGEVTSTGGEDPTVFIYWGDHDAGTCALYWDNRIDLGTKGPETFSSGITGLSLNTMANRAATNITSTSATLNGEVMDAGGEAPTVYYFRCYAENSAGGAWASSTESFRTLAVTAPPTVTIYWGDNDGGQTPLSWDYVEDLGAQTALFARSVSGLSPGTTYYFRCYAENSVGGAWAPSTASFSTPEPPTVINGAATSVTYRSATLNGEVTSTGGENPTVTIYWGDNDGGIDAVSWDSSISLGAMGAVTFSSGVTGLDDLTDYYFRCYASNSAGDAWAASTASFTTLEKPPPEPFHGTGGGCGSAVPSSPRGVAGRGALPAAWLALAALWIGLRASRRPARD